MADNCFADQLFGSVGLGAGCISQDTYLLYEHCFRYSGLKYIEKDAFKGLHELTSLSLQYNNLTKVEHGAFDQLLRLQTLNLFGNPHLQVGQLDSS